MFQRRLVRADWVDGGKGAGVRSFVTLKQLSLEAK